jgi:hypothetical protein
MLCNGCNEIGIIFFNSDLPRPTLLADCIHLLSVTTTRPIGQVTPSFGLSLLCALFDLLGPTLSLSGSNELDTAAIPANNQFDVVKNKLAANIPEHEQQEARLCSIIERKKLQEDNVLAQIVAKL